MEYTVSIGHGYDRVITLPADTIPVEDQQVNGARPLLYWATDPEPRRVTLLSINAESGTSVGTIIVVGQDPEAIDQALTAYGFTPLVTDTDNRHHTRRDATLDDLITILTEAHPDINGQARAWLNGLAELTPDPQTPDRWITRRTDDTDTALIWNSDQGAWDRD